MPDDRDIVDIPGLAPPGDRQLDRTPPPPPARAFLGVWFRCCHVYGRMYKSADGRAYSGRCPKCGTEVGAKVGQGGTSRRFFEAS